ncbi:MAG: YceI family protein [Gammaproteobacteria bacterium]|nr:YceI family protein [Gammaproteobacteria bacterium]
MVRQAGRAVPRAEKFTDGVCATLTALLLLVSAPGAAEPLLYQIDAAATHFAVVTHAVGPGHDHLITAQNYDAELVAEGDRLDGARFTLAVPVGALVVNAPAQVERLWPRLRALGIVEKPFPSLSEDDREAIIQRLRSESQLDAVGYPTLRARVLRIVDEAVTWNDHSFPQQVDIALTLRGRTLERRVPATVRLSGQRVRATAAGAFRFSDFDIKPYGTLFGLIRVADEFHVYVELAAAVQQGRSDSRQRALAANSPGL